MTTTTTINRKVDVDFTAVLDDFFADYDYEGIVSPCTAVLQSSHGPNGGPDNWEKPC